VGFAGSGGAWLQPASVNNAKQKAVSLNLVIASSPLQNRLE
jgi:hypothetical protein